MSTPALSTVAAFTLRSLLEHPDLRAADAIAAGPRADPDLDADAVADGLTELRERGLAEEEPGQGWRATDAGRAAAP
jgi:hypothetical protein